MHNLKQTILIIIFVYSLSALVLSFWQALPSSAIGVKSLEF